MIKSKLFATIAILPLFITAAHADRHRHSTVEKMNNHTHNDPKAHRSVFELNYGGAFVGLSKMTDTFLPSTSLNISKNDFDMSGLSFGLFVGKRIEIARNIFIGAEGFYQSDLAKNNLLFKYTKYIDVSNEPLKNQPITGFSTGESSDVYGLQGSVGFSISHDVLISANLGYSWGGNKYNGRRVSDNIFDKPVLDANGNVTRNKDNKIITQRTFFLNETVIEDNSGSGFKYGVSVEYALSDSFMVRLSGDIHKFKYTGTVTTTNHLVANAEPVISVRKGTLSRRNIAVSFLFSF